MNTELPWRQFATTVGPDMLPTIVDETLELHPNSSMKSRPVMLKTPAKIVDGKIVGFVGWSQHQTTPDEILNWSTDPRLGFGMRLGIIQAITIRAATSLGYCIERDRILHILRKHVTTSVQRRSDPSRGIILLKVKGGFPRLFRTETQHAEIEGLKDSTFLALAGGKMDYNWSCHIESDLQDLAKTKDPVTTAKIMRIFQLR